VGQGREGGWVGGGEVAFFLTGKWVLFLTCTVIVRLDNNKSRKFSTE